MSGNFDDILHLPRYEPKRHPRMSRYARAAQFAPFAALTGYDAAISETARLTDVFEERDDETVAILNRRMSRLFELVAQHPMVTVVYFQPDARKAGGSYQTRTGAVRKIMEFERLLELTDGMQIPLDAIIDINIEQEKNSKN